MSKYFVCKGDAIKLNRIDDGSLVVSGTIPPDEQINDAVVIRLQDSFAPSALWCYANSVATTIEIMEQYGLTIPDSLDEVHAYFSMMAIRADERPRKKFPTP